MASQSGTMGQGVLGGPTLGGPGEPTDALAASDAWTMGLVAVGAPYRRPSTLGLAVLGSFVLAGPGDTTLAAADAWTATSTAVLTDVDALTATDTWHQGGTATLTVSVVLAANDKWVEGGIATINLPGTLAASAEWATGGSAALADKVALAAGDAWAMTASASVSGSAGPSPEVGWGPLGWAALGGAGNGTAPNDVFVATDTWQWGAGAAMTRPATLAAADAWTLGSGATVDEAGVPSELGWGTLGQSVLGGGGNGALPSAALNATDTWQWADQVSLGLPPASHTPSSTLGWGALGFATLAGGGGSSSACNATDTWHQGGTATLTVQPGVVDLWTLGSRAQLQTERGLGIEAAGLLGRGLLGLSPLANGSGSSTTLGSVESFRWDGQALFGNGQAQTIPWIGQGYTGQFLIGGPVSFAGLIAGDSWAMGGRAAVRPILAATDLWTLGDAATPSNSSAARDDWLLAAQAALVLFLPPTAACEGQSVGELTAVRAGAVLDLALLTQAASFVTSMQAKMLGRRTTVSQGVAFASPVSTAQSVGSVTLAARAVRETAAVAATVEAC